MIPNILSIAGTDPTGGAGIQADLKSFAAHGGYGMCVVTALVAQNTQGVREIHAPPVQFLRAQLDAVSEDVTVHAAKTGMLGTAEIIETVSDWWDTNYGNEGRSSRAKTRTGAVAPVLVVDPVMVATSGDRLLEAEAEQSLIEFLHRADLITPNVPELAILASAEPAASSTELISQAQQVADAHHTVVLAKGGHMGAPTVTDTLVFPADHGTRPEAYSVSTPRIETPNTHGTGCSVSAAFATLRARGLSWEQSLDRVKEWMQRALIGAEQLDVGQGNGPINHFP
ncbi:bifunctional hydroxymethylpyrimidine kinase/phosphomethylpyrimidine kinase [Nesterenkonia ebinurensis]|uniref:bifunctional hydroxymethylpyrimidine kinase/phosphomethylpyrimidine kinase n=1 Tax=Nesterenkonia ebinurensis TaxID=2608252 RepID=UPI001CC5CE3A|nr:bifunctional hydroxymethylpyrimidine kinase/phosphomethylpyrimidine kinase [Nesterenkonia ebinurensis]